MRKFSILHLSDLHIINYRKSYPLVLKELIKDIAKETKNIESLVLVVTGDIIDKARYDKALDAVVLFFCDLKSELGDKIDRMYFTPGNHDKNRITCNDLMQDFFNGKKHNELYNEFEKGDWTNLFSHLFDNYINLLNRISEETGIKVVTDLFYCDVFEINGCFVRINSINSSLSSFNDNDYGSLHIGKFQIEKIEQDFEEKKELIDNNDIDVSLTIMHHPTFWLCKEEYDEVHFSIASHDSLSTDVLLRGHTHNRSLESYYSLYNSFSTLVTGIGSSTKDKDYKQRYSVYTFMCDLNLVEIVMKASSEKGFIPDYSAYVGEADETRKKIHFPIHVHDFFSDIYLKLPLVKDDFQPIFPTKEVLKNMSEYSNKLLNLKERLTSCLFTYKQQFITFLSEDTEEQFSKNKEHIKEMQSFLLKQGNVDLNDSSTSYIENILKKYCKKIHELVDGLLYELCLEITSVFFNECLNDDEQVRVQFRVFNSKKHSHEGLTNHSIKGKTPIVLSNITPVNWGNGLIKESFKKNVPLIYSLNQECVQDRLSDTIWKDYITYAPNIIGNSFYNSRKKETYPILSFGINSNCKDCYTFFETLSLLPIKTIIDDYLLDIYNSFKFSFESLLRKK